MNLKGFDKIILIRSFYGSSILTLNEFIIGHLAYHITKKSQTFYDFKN